MAFSPPSTSSQRGQLVGIRDGTRKGWDQKSVGRLQVPHGLDKAIEALRLGQDTDAATRHQSAQRLEYAGVKGVRGKLQHA